MTEHTHGMRGQIIYSPYSSPNGGLSQKAQQVTIVGPDIPAVDPVASNAPAVIVAETMPGYTVLRPAEDPAPDRTSYMASGNYVAPAVNGIAWRGVFGHYGAIPLHDRTESWAEYQQMSD